MNRSILATLAALAAFAPLSAAQAQSQSHAGMSAQDHAAMQAPANGVATTPADNAMLSSAPTTFSATFPHAMVLTSLRLTGGPSNQAVDVALSAEAAPAVTVSAAASGPRARHLRRRLDREGRRRPSDERRRPFHGSLRRRPPAS